MVFCKGRCFNKYGGVNCIKTDDIIGISRDESSFNLYSKGTVRGRGQIITTNIPHYQGKLLPGQLIPDDAWWEVRQETKKGYTELTDTCISDKILREYNCRKTYSATEESSPANAREISGMIESRDYYCPAGCSEGACKQINKSTGFKFYANSSDSKHLILEYQGIQYDFLKGDGTQYTNWGESFKNYIRLT